MATYTNQTKTSTTFVNEAYDTGRVDLLIGDGFYLHIEGLLNLDIELNRGASLVNQSKTSTTFSNLVKN